MNFRIEYGKYLIRRPLKNLLSLGLNRNKNFENSLKNKKKKSILPTAISFSRRASITR
jgi:hypothetical protein